MSYLLSEIVRVGPNPILIQRRTALIQMDCEEDRGEHKTIGFAGDAVTKT